MIEFSLSGNSDIARALAGLPAKLQKEAALEAMIVAVQPTVAAAKAYAPVASGDLRRSIGFRVKRYSKGLVTFGIVGSRRGFGTDGREPANYAHLVEFGHRVAKGGKLTRLDGAGRKGNGTVGGNVPAQPFMRPAWDATKDEVLAALGRELGERLEAEVKRRQSRRKGGRA